MNKCILFILFILCYNIAYGYTDNQIADAIYKAENSRTHPYGILKHYRTTTPRQACINTIRHAVKDWNKQGDFIVFLGSRYCPVNCDNDNGTNKYWVKNVKYFLLKGGK
jgi:hypothetical protein